MTGVPAPVWAFAAAKVGFHVATTRLSYHRDELYFISASERLTPSYVDFQPVTPVLVRVVRALLGDSLTGLRLIPALAGALVVVLAADIARELGGNRRAQVFAGFVTLVIPLFVGANSALNTVSLEIPAWLLIVAFVARIERTDDARLWPVAGVAIGIALLVKFTVLGYLAAIPVAVAVTPLRRHLRTPWPWVGAAVALAIVLPSLVWQFQHGFPVVEFVSNQSSGGKVLGLGGRIGYLASLVVFPGPVGLVVLIPGLVWLWRRSAARAVAAVTFVPILVFAAAGGKGYYASPALAVASVAGAIAITTWRPAIPRSLIAGLVVNLLVALPLLVPMVPTSVLRSNPDIAQATEMGERIGWDDLAAQVAEILRTLPDDERRRAVVIGANYAIASAMELYADRYGLPAAVSGHNSSYLWWPDIPAGHIAVIVGLDEAGMHRLYDDVERVGTVRNRAGVENYEWGKAIWIGRRPLVTPAQLRERLRVFTA